jgi:hypothetical protein
MQSNLKFLQMNASKEKMIPEGLHELGIDLDLKDCDVKF